MADLVPSGQQPTVHYINMLFVPLRFNVYGDYINCLRDNYGCTVRSLDLCDVEQVAQANQEISDATNGKFTNYFRLGMEIVFIN